MTAKSIEIRENDEPSRTFVLQIDPEHEVVMKLSSTGGRAIAFLGASGHSLEMLHAGRDLRGYIVYRETAREAMMLLSMLLSKGKAFISAGPTYLVNLRSVPISEITFTRQGDHPAVIVISRAAAEQIDSLIKRGSFDRGELIVLISLAAFHILSGDRARIGEESQWLH